MPDLLKDFFDERLSFYFEVGGDFIENTAQKADFQWLVFENSNVMFCAHDGVR